MVKVIIWALVALTAASTVGAMKIHTDKWCADHHLAEGAAECLKNDGCCFDGSVQSCHSCTHHSDEWCMRYGVDPDSGEIDAVICASFSGCTFDRGEGTDTVGDGVVDAYENTRCISTSEPLSDIQTCSDLSGEGMDVFELKQEKKCEDSEDEEECETHLVQDFYPVCTDQGEFIAEQKDFESGLSWCVDENGHEIPETRKNTKTCPEGGECIQKPLDQDPFMIDCSVQRLKFSGWQCPNAMTLSTGDGEVVQNDSEEVGNCDMECNTDTDCDGSEWCCYNGCGKTCLEPIKPLADCENVASVLKEYHSSVGTEQMHSAEATVSCKEGWFGDAPQTVECKHGNWDPIEVQCKKDCPRFKIRNADHPNERSRDYNVQGEGVHHGDERVVSCVKNYGPVNGLPDAMKYGQETIRCVNGNWQSTEANINKPPVPERTLMCSACFDAQPHVWMDEQERACDFYSSRPAQCAENEEAKEYCREACRTCDEKEELYKVRQVVSTLRDVEHRANWKRGLHKVFKPVTKTREASREVMVPAKRVKRGAVGGKSGRARREREAEADGVA